MKGTNNIGRAGNDIGRGRVQYPFPVAQYFA